MKSHTLIHTGPQVGRARRIVLVSSELQVKDATTSARCQLPQRRRDLAINILPASPSARNFAASRALPHR